MRETPLAHKSPYARFTCQQAWRPYYMQSLKWLHATLADEQPAGRGITAYGRSSADDFACSSPWPKMPMTRACRVHENGAVKASLNSALLRPHQHALQLC